MSAAATDLALSLSVHADDGCRGNAGGHVSAARVGADGHEVRPEDRMESARAGGARRGSEDVRVPTAHAVREFGTYITANRPFIPNYGDRYRHGETISTAFVESAINQVLSKRFVKKQQMRWTDRGAHLLLQVRTRVLNEDWRSTLSRWYPGMDETCDAKAA